MRSKDEDDREHKLDRLARILAGAEVSRREVIKATAGTVLGISLADPIAALANTAGKQPHCPHGHVRCGSNCCKPHYHCVTTHHGKRVVHTCKPPAKKPQCTTAANCPAAAAGSCLQAACTAGVCGFVADAANAPASTACATGTCTGTTAGFTFIAAEVRCGTGSSTVCDGSGHCVGCVSAHDCPAAAAGSCKAAVCTNGTCGFIADDTNAPSSTACATATCVAGAATITPAAAHTSCGQGKVCDGAGNCVGCATAADCPAAGAGSCQAAVCTNGVCGFAADNTNAPVSTACATSTCANGAPQTTPVAVDTTCGNAPHMVCDGQGHCVGCATAADCPPASAGSCQQATCASGVCGFGVDNTNLPASTACTTGTCTSGVPGQTSVAQGTPCGTNGICDGAGSCGCAPGLTNCDTQGGVQCELPVCSGGSVSVCGGTSTPCAPYICNVAGTACLTSCANSDANCTSGYYCSGLNNCVAKQSTGTPCTAADQCASGNCVNSFCCNTACQGTCMACSTAAKGTGANGMCGQIAAGLPAPAGQCPDLGAASCGTNGTCNGSGACADYPAGTSCGAAQSCSGSTLTPASTCTGTGTCAAGTPMPCPNNLICGSSTQCATTCTPLSTTGCATGTCNALGTGCS